MKTASRIFIILGMVLNFSINWILGVIGAAIGIIALVSLAKGQKSIAFGIVTILFCSVLGGIFYLCWKPDEK